VQLMCQASDVLRRAQMEGTLASSDPTESAGPYVRRPPRQVDATAKMIVLGTGGGGMPKRTRTGYANAVVVGETAYMIDCGEGVHAQAWRSGISMHTTRRPPGGSTIKAMFFTHLHADHTIDLANLMLGFWPDHPLDLYGPGEAGLPITAYPLGREVDWVFPKNPTPGLRGMTNALLQAWAYNLNVRIADEGRPDFTKQLTVHEIGVHHGSYEPDIDIGVALGGGGASGTSALTAAPAMEPIEIMPTDENGVRVTAILVQHAPVFPALAYRFDTPGGSVVFSGDTGPCDNVARLARGADILVHEVIDVEFLAHRVAQLPNRDAIIAHLSGSHTPVAEAGKIAERAGVKTLVLSHLVPGDDEFTEEDWESRARPHFNGEVVCGVDLDQFSLD
jgi:ribonuclease BN (tRNA processing enzyme)